MMKRKKEHYRSFQIAGFTYYDGPFFFEDLKIGTPLTLKRDKKNKYDPQAIQIMYQDVKIGYVPRVHNNTLYKLLKIGFKDILCVITRKDPHTTTENQITVAVYFVKEKTSKKEKQDEVIETVQ